MKSLHITINVEVADKGYPGTSPAQGKAEVHLEVPERFRTIAISEELVV